MRTDRTRAQGIRSGPARRAAAALGIGAALVLAAACGGDDSEAADATPAPTTAAAPATASAGGGVTIEHAFGSTVVAAPPERLVVVGYKEQDYFLALGTVPVGIREWFGGHPSAVWPWAESYLDGEAPVALTRELNFEQIAALEPDLIVGLTSGMSQEEYDNLSSIAPTIAQATDAGDFEAGWQDLTLAAGRILGREREAEALVADLEARIDAAAEDFPELQGATTTLASAFEGQYYLYNSTATPMKVLAEIGMSVPAEVDAATDNPDEFLVLSAERFDLLDVDVLLWSEGTDDPGIAALLSDPVYGNLAVRSEGRDVFLGDANGAFVFSSVLSLPYVLDEVVPQLVLAADGDPSTASSYGAP